MLIDIACVLVMVSVLISPTHPWVEQTLLTFDLELGDMANRKSSRVEAVSLWIEGKKKLNILIYHFHRWMDQSALSLKSRYNLATIMSLSTRHAYVMWCKYLTNSQQYNIFQRVFPPLCTKIVHFVIKTKKVVCKQLSQKRCDSCSKSIPRNLDSSFYNAFSND
jgi:hypothetical protein